MTVIKKKALISYILIFLGAFFLPLAASQMRTSIRDIQEFSFCVVGYLGLAGAAGLGIMGLGAFVAGVVLFRLARE